VRVALFFVFLLAMRVIVRAPARSRNVGRRTSLPKRSVSAAFGEQDRAVLATRSLCSRASIVGGAAGSPTERDHDTPTRRNRDDARGRTGESARRRSPCRASAGGDFPKRFQAVANSATDATLGSASTPGGAKGAARVAVPIERNGCGTCWLGHSRS
jgi:hypothetical protein